DIYHALQATLMARLPVWPTIGQALAEGRLDEPNSLLPARASKPHRRGFFGRSWGLGRGSGPGRAAEPRVRRVGRAVVP
ncbi:hypothetical protein, partial [Rothia dentocariosa]